MIGGVDFKQPSEFSISRGQMLEQNAVMRKHGAQIAKTGKGSSGEQ
jgi:hypothetical protein